MCIGVGTRSRSLEQLWHMLQLMMIGSRKETTSDHDREDDVL